MKSDVSMVWYGIIINKNTYRHLDKQKIFRKLILMIL